MPKNEPSPELIKDLQALISSWEAESHEEPTGGYRFPSLFGWDTGHEACAVALREVLHKHGIKQS